MSNKWRDSIGGRDRQFIPPITVGRLIELLSEYPAEAKVLIDTRFTSKPYCFGRIQFEFRGERPQLLILGPNDHPVDLARKGEEL